MKKKLTYAVHAVTTALVELIETYSHAIDFYSQEKFISDRLVLLYYHTIADADSWSETYCSNLFRRASKKVLFQYNHRLGAIFFDAIHHEQVGKCSLRSRREVNSTSTNLEPLNLPNPMAEIEKSVANFDKVIENEEPVETLYEYYDDQGASGRGDKRKVVRLESQCRTKYMDILKSDALKNCRKLGSWRKRANHLINDLKVMRRSCT